MKTAMTAVGVLALVAAAPLAVRAQCTNLTGSPAPTAEQYAANLIKLSYLPTGPGSGDDRPILKKSLFTAPSLAFDPLTTHTLHVTMTKNTLGGPLLWSTSIPPSSTLWTNVGNKWVFSDPATTYGVRKIKVVSFPGGAYVITKLLGRNTNISNAPVAAGVDNAHVLVEIEAGGTGICYDGDTGACTGTGNTQTCKVP